MTTYVKGVELSKRHDCDVCFVTRDEMVSGWVVCLWMKLMRRRRGSELKEGKILDSFS